MPLVANQASDVIAAGDTQFQKAMDGINEMEGILCCLADDDRFQYALSKDCVQKAIKHWVGHTRLGDEERDALFDEEEPHYQELIMPAMKGFKKVEVHAKRLGRPFPFFEVMNGERKLRSKPAEEKKLEEVREEVYQEARVVQGKQGHGMMIGIQLGFLLLLWLNRDTFLSEYGGNWSHNMSNLNRSSAFSSAGEPMDSQIRLDGTSDSPDETCNGHSCAEEEDDSETDVDPQATCIGDACAESELESVPPLDNPSTLNQNETKVGWLQSLLNFSWFGAL